MYEIEVPDIFHFCNYSFFAYFMGAVILITSFTRYKCYRFVKKTLVVIGGYWKEWINLHTRLKIYKIL